MKVHATSALQRVNTAQSSQRAPRHMYGRDSIGKAFLPSLLDFLPSTRSVPVSCTCCYGWAHICAILDFISSFEHFAAYVRAMYTPLGENNRVLVLPRVGIHARTAAPDPAHMLLQLRLRTLLLIDWSVHIIFSRHSQVHVRFFQSALVKSFSMRSQMSLQCTFLSFLRPFTDSILDISSWGLVYMPLGQTIPELCFQCSVATRRLCH